MKKYIFAFFTVLAYLWGNVGWGQTDSFVYTQTEKGFSKINAQNGQIIWTNSSTYLYEGKPTLSNGLIVLNSDDGLVTLHEKDGTFNWKIEVAGNGNYDSYDTQPVIFKNTIIITTRNYDIYCYDLTKGNKLWEYKNTKWSNIYQGKRMRII